MPDTGVIGPAFWVIAGIMIVASLGVVTLRNMVHSALCLAVVLLLAAGLYLQLNADLLAGFQVLLYVGAVVTLILIAVMLIQNIAAKTIVQTNQRWLPSLLVSLATLSLLWYAIGSADWAAGVEDLRDELDGLLVHGQIEVRGEPALVAAEAPGAAVLLADPVTREQAEQLAAALAEAIQAATVTRGQLTELLTQVDYQGPLTAAHFETILHRPKRAQAKALLAALDQYEQAASDARGDLARVLHGAKLAVPANPELLQPEALAWLQPVGLRREAVGALARLRSLLGEAAMARAQLTLACRAAGVPLRTPIERLDRASIEQVPNAVHRRRIEGSLNRLLVILGKSRTDVIRDELHELLAVSGLTPSDEQLDAVAATYFEGISDVAVRARAREAHALLQAELRRGYPYEEQMRVLSMALFDKYVLVFEVAGILLLVALLGAIVIAQQTGPEARGR